MHSVETYIPFVDNKNPAIDQVSQLQQEIRKMAPKYYYFISKVPRRLPSYSHVNYT